MQNAEAPQRTICDSTQVEEFASCGINSRLVLRSSARPRHWWKWPPRPSLVLHGNYYL